jgi:hypothetical protein
MRRGFTRRWSTPPRDIESRANAAIAIRRAAHCARDSRRADHKGGHATPVRYAVDVSRGTHANARLRGDARGGDGGVREELAAGVVLRSGEVRFRGQTGKHLLCLRFPVLTPVVGTRTDISSPEQLVAVQIPLAPFQHPARCDTITVRGFDPWGRL